MKYITIILLFLASVLQGQTGAAYWHGSTEPGTITPEVDTLTLTYWDDFILLHIANTGITEDVNGVSQWKDRSGKGNHSTQSVNLNKPTTDVDGNVVFDGVDKYLSSTDYFSTSGADTSFTVFCVVEPAAYTNSMRIIEKYKNTGSTHGFIFFIGSNAVDKIVYKQFIQDASSSSQVADSITVINTTYLVTYAVSETTTQEIRVNGVEESSVAANPPFSGGDNGSKIGVNANGTTGFFNGKIKFIGIANRKFTPAEIATTESELNSFFTIY